MIASGLSCQCARWGCTCRTGASAKKWLDEQYPAIAALARTEGAGIHCGDETGLRSDDVRGRSYAPQGQAPVVRVNNKHHGPSIISTITHRGTMRWKIFDGALNAGLLIDFMKRLIRDTDHKVYLILDNLPVHHSNSTRFVVARTAAMGKWRTFATTESLSDARRFHRQVVRPQAEP